MIKSKRTKFKLFDFKLFILTFDFIFNNRKKKKESKDKRKLKEKMSLKMEFQNDIVDHNQQGDNEIFNLNKIKTKKVNQIIIKSLLTQLNFYSNIYYKAID